jgi:hypothetical protein
MEEHEIQQVSSEILNLVPTWHKDIADIHFDRIDFVPCEEYQGSQFGVYKIPWKALFVILDEYYVDMYKSQTLSEEELFDCEKFMRIIDFWKHGTPLIPPILTSSGHGKLVPVDGKHRLKLSSLTKSEEVVVIVYDIDIILVSELLPIITYKIA